MKTGNLLIALVVGGAVGFIAGRATVSDSRPNEPLKAQVAAAAARPSEAPPPARPAAARPTEDANTVYKIPVRDAPTKGPATAKVTVIEYSEFECPFCSRVGPTLQQIRDTYGDDVRIAFKHLPLDFHANADLAAQASLAAGEQGKFWEFHDKLFENQKALKRADLERYAQELKLDLKRFNSALDSGKFKAHIERDKQEAATFGARGTPTFFINGRKLRGAQPFPAFKAVIDEEIKKADAELARGVKPTKLYDTLIAQGLTEAAAPTPQPQQPDRAPAAEFAEVKDIAGAPFKGPQHAKVTIVEWSDFECPFCGRVTATLDQIRKEYPNDVRLVFKHQPLSFHQNAKPAAIASMAAHRQGKFWEFHDLAFANMRALNRDNFVAWARQLGLNVAKFEKDLEDPKLAEYVEKDSSYGNSVGANGTPAFFINGRKLSGAQPFPAFKAIIDEELKKADELLKKGTRLEQLYEKILAENKANAPAIAARAAAAEEAPVKLDVGDAPVKGARNAAVTIIGYSDFECPFCGRVNPTLDRLLKEYDGKVRFAFKNQPLAFHANARPAAIAALAAGRQGKFWEFHDKLFENRQAMQRADFERYAQELGLNAAKFQKDLDDPKLAAQVDADQAEANKIGATGTPTFFINGRKLVGAQPFEAFKKMVDEELAKK